MAGDNEIIKNWPERRAALEKELRTWRQPNDPSRIAQAMEIFRNYPRVMRTGQGAAVKRDRLKAITTAFDKLMDLPIDEFLGYDVYEQLEAMRDRLRDAVAHPERLKGRRQGRPPRWIPDQIAQRAQKAHAVISGNNRKIPEKLLIRTFRVLGFPKAELVAAQAFRRLRVK